MVVATDHVILTIEQEIDHEVFNRIANRLHDTEVVDVGAE